MSSKKVLLTGASGAVGHEVLKQLVSSKDSHEIIAFDIPSRRAVKRLNKFKNKAQIHFGDITKPIDLDLVTKDIDVVIHLAAIIPPEAYVHHEKAYSVNVNGTQNVIAAIKKNSPDAFLLYSSSVALYGDRLNNPMISVDDPLTPSPGDYYAITKLAAEKEVRDSGLDWAIFRLSAIMGEHKMSGLMFQQPLNTLMEITTTVDTGRAFANALNFKEQLQGRIFNLGGGDNCRTNYQDFLDRSFEIAGLGIANFPEKAFAEKNFHCGYYSDGYLLNDIIGFQQDDMEAYYQSEARKVNGITKSLTTLFSKPIKKYLLKKSAPYRAYTEDDQELIEQFFDI